MALKRYSTLVALATFFLIIAGGLVTSTGSGLSVPDWPLSFGQWMPPMVGGVFFEHGHRMIASAVGLLTVILAVCVWRSREASALAKKLALASVLAVLFQGVLGGVTVLLKLPTLVSVSHAVLGQLFFTLTVSLSSVLWGITPFENPHAKRLAWMTAAFILAQLILGALYRHGGSAHALYTHMAVAALVLLHLILLRRRMKTPLTHALLALVGVQIVLGVFSWQLPYVAVTTAHVGVGALLLAGTTVAALKTLCR